MGRLFIKTMNKNGKLVNCKTCNKEFYAPLWQLERNRQYCSEDCYHQDTQGKKPWNTGIKRWWFSPTEFKVGQTSGDKNVNWKGGVTKDMVRFSEEYKQWRNAVFVRDNFTCVWCGKKGGRIEADHVYPQAYFPEKRFEVSNGRTLCKNCHKRTITYLNNYLDTGFISTTSGYFALMVNELPVDEVSDSNKIYGMWNDGSVEIEVGEFLMSLVRLIKPKEILETGCYKGWSSAYMATGLRENGFGHVTTLEIEQRHIDHSVALWSKLNVSEFITVERIKSLEYQPKTKYQLLFLDSEPDLRFNELIKYFECLDEGGYIFIHDLPRSLCQGNINPDWPNYQSWPFGNIPEKMKCMVKEGILVPFHFPSPRGMVGFYKVSGNDYVWR